MGTTTSSSDSRWYFFQDADGRWRWDAVAANGAVLVHGAARFATRAECVEDAKSCGYDTLPTLRRDITSTPAQPRN